MQVETRYRHIRKFVEVSDQAPRRVQRIKLSNGYNFSFCTTILVYLVREAMCSVSTTLSRLQSTVLQRFQKTLRFRKIMVVKSNSRQFCKLWVVKTIANRFEQKIPANGDDTKCWERSLKNCNNWKRKESQLYHICWYQSLLCHAARSDRR